MHCLLGLVVTWSSVSSWKMPWFASIDFQSYSNFCSSYVWRDRSINFNSNFPKTSQSINTSLRFKFTYILQFHLFTSCACTNWWLSHSQDSIRFNNSLADSKTVFAGRFRIKLKTPLYTLRMREKIVTICSVIYVFVFCFPRLQCYAF